MGRDEAFAQLQVLFTVVDHALGQLLGMRQKEVDVEGARSSQHLCRRIKSGALLAIGLVRLGPPAWAYSLAVIGVVAGAGATHRSRWYVTPAFTTVLVFLLLLYARPQDAASRFSERVLETVLGVGIAYAFGLGLPSVVRRYRERVS